MNNLTQRVMTGALLGVIMIGSIMFSPISFLLLLLLISILGLAEFYRLVQSESVFPLKIPGIISGVVIFAVFAYVSWFQNGYQWMIIAFPILAILFIWEIYRNLPNPFQNIAITITGILYVILPMLLLVHIGFAFDAAAGYEYHGSVVMGCIFLLWASDSGAYFVGSKFGKHRLFERISPKKSWEGFFGGMALSLLVAVIISNYFLELSTLQWLIVSLLIVITGTLGDLVKSLLKRSIGVKDSGTILPGHGGILDRFDGLLISTYFVFTYLFLLGKI